MKTVGFYEFVWYRVLVVDGDVFDLDVFVAEALYGAVVDLVAVVEDDDAFAEGFDVVHVVCGEEQGDVGFVVESFEDGADALFGVCVEADRGFVEVEDARAVEKACDEFAFHALAQAEFPDR